MPDDRARGHHARLARTIRSLQSHLRMLLVQGSQHLLLPRISIATVDRALKELVEHGAILQRKRKNDAGDWTSNLYTVLALPMGVATNLALPHTRIAATGKRKDVALTRPNMNDKQELRVYPLEIPKAEPAPTKDGLLATAQQFRELSETGTPKMRQTMLKLAQRFEAQAQEISNETITDSNTGN